MNVLLQIAVGTFSRAVESKILLGGDHPVPAKLFEVDYKGVSTAPGLLRFFAAVDSHLIVSFCSGLGPVYSGHVDIHILEKRRAIR